MSSIFQKNGYHGYKYLICLFTFLLSSSPLFSIDSANNNCQSILKEAQSMYEKLQFDSAIQLLQPCLEQGFNDTERLNALKILTDIYLIKKHEKDAQNSHIEFLRTYYRIHLNYNYQVDTAQVELYHLHSKIRKFFTEKETYIILLDTAQFNSSNRKSETTKSKELKKRLHWFFENSRVINFYPDEPISENQNIQNFTLYSDDYYKHLLDLERYFLVSLIIHQTTSNLKADISLTRFSTREKVLNDSISASQIIALADSIGIKLARYFKYSIQFKGFDIPEKLYPAFAGIFGLSSLFYILADNEKSDYLDAYTSSDAKQRYSKLRFYENSRNSLGGVTGLTIGLVGYEFLNPRIPVFIKIRR